MEASEYQKKAMETAVYPNIGNNFAYVALGLTDETGEVVEKIEEFASPEEIVKEVGDCLWYAAGCATEAGLDLGEILNYSESLGFGNSESYESNQNGMVVYAAKIAGYAKKAIRDDEGSITDKRRGVIEEALAGFMYWTQRFLNQSYGIDTGVVMPQNIAKLTKRKEKGTLKGDGDNR